MSSTGVSSTMSHHDFTRFTLDEKYIIGTHHEFQPAPAPKSLYVHHPCPLLHLDPEDTSSISDSSSSDSESDIEEASYRARGRDIVNSWLSSNSHRDDAPLRPPRIFLTHEMSSDVSTSSSQPSPVSDVFKNTSVPDDLVSDISSMMGSCVSDDKSCTSSSGEEAIDEGDTKSLLRREVPTQSKIQAGIYTTVPLTPTTLQGYINSYQQQPKYHKARRTPPQPKANPEEPKSGWMRMQESTQKMERETAMKERSKNVNEFAKWRGAVMPWM
ncbi:hypothetical protein FRC07_005902 [Ceratobasidium sp. 392]|nr:hypothetical protein FRC07_005902 [Ceratobasidium sp. 392]